MTNPNIFDTNDFADVPKDIADKLATETNAGATLWGALVVAAAEAGVTEMDINTLMAFAHKAIARAPGVYFPVDYSIPTQQTVRNYLNKAIDMKIIAKPSRQTYGVISEVTEAVEAAPAKTKGATKAEAVVAPAAAVSSDPLAGL